ncbi:MAG: Gfo/Idh/MocA family oxidoreductase, partial [Lentisphaerota bacterium]
KAQVMVDHVMRYTQIIQKAKEVITAGSIGKVCSFNFVRYHDGGALFTTFPRTMAGGGEQLIEKATHDLYVAFYLCGAAPLKVTGMCRLQKFGGNKPEDLTCAKCDDFKCSNRLSVGKSSNAAVNDINLSHDLCSFSKAVDVYDNEMCMVECTNNVFGVYSHCFFVNNHFSRRYEIIGTEGMLYIELTLREKHYNCDGRITVARAAPLLPLPGIEEYNFNYQGRIHYNGGPFAGRHFYDMIQGKAEPFTTVEDAFAAEMVGIAAMKSSEEHRQINIEQDIVSQDLLPAFSEAYKGF